MNNITNKQEFDKWLSMTPQSVENLFYRLPGSSKTKLESYDLNGLQEISKWTLENISNINDLESNPELWNELSCYIGKVCEKILNGRWSIELDDEDYIYFREPEITFDSLDPICPMYLITTLLSRQNSSFITTIIEKELQLL